MTYDRERAFRQGQKMLGNQNAKGHGGKGRRTERHFLAPHTRSAPIDLDLILDRIAKIGGETNGG